MLALSRLGAQFLHVECMRRGQRAARHDRVCVCCTAGAREDEMHFIQCAAYAGARTRYPDLFEGFRPLPCWEDGDMRYGCEIWVWI